MIATLAGNHLAIKARGEGADCLVDHRPRNLRRFHTFFFS